MCLCLARLRDLAWLGLRCSYGPELWRSNGQASGTAIVHDIVRGSKGSFPTMLTVFTPRPNDIAPTIYFFIKSDRGFVFGTGGSEVRIVYSCSGCMP